ncbi:hypothetical protein VARIO8X_20059 [Burkholderiales bacterium 8X]|nr:hypothetical protein VARIO8X_20059 [Burkholderiales bacterium 8X]
MHSMHACCCCWPTTSARARYCAKRSPRPPCRAKNPLCFLISRTHHDDIARTFERSRAPLPKRLRQRVRHRGHRRRAAAGPQQPAARAARPLSRADLGHRLHRAPAREPPQLAVPPPAFGGLRPLRGVCAIDLDHRRRPRHRLDARTDALAPDPDRQSGRRFRRRHPYPGRQRRCRGAERHRRASVPGRPLDGAAGAGQCRRRDAARAAAGPAGHHHRNGRAGREAGRDRAGTARRGLQGGAAGRPLARLHLRELRRPVPAARARPDRLQRPRQCARLQGAGGGLRKPTRRVRDRQEIRRPLLARTDAAIALQRGGLARQPGPGQVRHRQLHDHRLDQLRPSGSVDLHRAHLAERHPGHGQLRLRDLPAALAGDGRHLSSALVPPQPDERIHGPGVRRIRRQARRLQAGRREPAQLDGAARARRRSLREGQQRRPQATEARQHAGLHVREPAALHPDPLRAAEPRARPGLRRLLGRPARPIQILTIQRTQDDEQRQPPGRHPPAIASQLGRIRQHRRLRLPDPEPALRTLSPGRQQRDCPHRRGDRRPGARPESGRPGRP